MYVFLGMAEKNPAFHDGLTWFACSTKKNTFRGTMLSLLIGVNIIL